MKTATRQVNRSVVSVLGIGMLLLAFTAIFMSRSLSAAGFENVDPPQNTSVEDKVEVLEFLWLGCPHCYALEPTMQDWKKTKPDYVEFVREAPPLNPAWEAHSRGFYAAQFMGKEAEFVDAMFDAIHEKKKNMRNPKEIAKLAATLGMDEGKFLSTMDSFAVNGKLKQSVDKAIKAGISSVPSIIINGKYRSSTTISGGADGVVDTINERVAFEKEAMKLP